MNDPSQGSVGRRCCYPELQRPCLVYRARKNLISNALIYRQALAGYRCWIDGGGACRHLAIQANSLTWPYPNNSAKCYRLDVRTQPGSIRPQTVARSGLKSMSPRMVLRARSSERAQ